MNNVLYRKKIDFFNIINVAIMSLICLVTIYPIWYTVVNSFNDGADAMMGGIYWWPRKFSLDSYAAVFRNSGVVQAFGVAIFRTVLGTITHIFLVSMTAYVLTKTKLFGRKAILGLATFTMFFSGGLIPFFILIRDLHLLNSLMVYVVPTMFNFFHVIIFMSFFRELPASLEESAIIDGANEFTVFLRIILPLSMPVLATIALFQGVWHWNDYFFGTIYINSPELQPISTYLYRVIAETSSASMLNNMPAGMRTQTVTMQTIKLATMVVATFPIVATYPFLQRYFVQGMMIGSIKG